MKFLTPLLLIALLIVQPIHAQDAMSTDRPDFTESPLTVGQGTIQVEAGLTHQSAGDTSLLTTGEGLVRYGLRSKFELRLGLPSFVSSDAIDNGLTDVSVGFKWNLANLDSGVNAGLVTGLTLPTGDLGADDPNPTIILVAGMPVNDRLSVASQVGSTVFKLADEWKSMWFATVVLSAPINDQLGAFVELKGENLPETEDNRFIVHTGLVYPVSDNLQIDLHLGTGLNDFSGDEFIGFGVAFRR